MTALVEFFPTLKLSKFVNPLRRFPTLMGRPLRVIALASAVTLIVLNVPSGKASESAQLAQAGGIKGQDVMGDRDKSGADGFVQAPVPREKGASGASATEAGGGGTKADAPRPGPGPATLPPGQDPGTPATATSVSGGSPAAVDKAK